MASDFFRRGSCSWFTDHESNVAGIGRQESLRVYTYERVEDARSLRRRNALRGF